MKNVWVRLACTLILLGLCACEEEIANVPQTRYYESWADPRCLVVARGDTGMLSRVPEWAYNYVGNEPEGVTHIGLSGIAFPPQGSWYPRPDGSVLVAVSPEAPLDTATVEFYGQDNSGYTSASTYYFLTIVDSPLPPPSLPSFCS